MFRFRKFRVPQPKPEDFTVPVLKDTYTKDGTRLCSVVDVSASSIGADLPKPEDYKLSALQRAGVPLNFVNANVLDSSPTEAEADAFLNSLESHDDDSNVSPDNND